MYELLKMTPDRIATYEHFKTLYTSRDITKNDIVNICRHLEVEYLMNNLGNQEFEPEPITEGGIRFKSYDGNGPGKYSCYKSIRFLMNKSWPVVDRENPWQSGDVEIAVPGHTRIDLFLKAFDGAPKWTKEEKNLFKAVLTNNGFVSSKRGLVIK